MSQSVLSGATGYPVARPIDPGVRIGHVHLKVADLERALAFGATAAIAWELAEFFAFISKSTEREFAYADTLGDLSLGVAGAVVAAVVLHRSWRHGRLLDPGPLPPRVAA